MKRLLPLVLALPCLAAAAPPASVASALEYLKKQKSYSWEIINGDPGLVASQVQTRRGPVTLVQQNTTPNLKGSVDLAGDTLIRREWPEGLQLDTLITAAGETVTRTPEGWMTEKEILTAQAEERLRENRLTERAVWLRRADRPEVRRPDEELAPLLQAEAKFEEVATDTFVTRGSSPSPTDPSAADDVTITLRLRAGMIRDYEVKIEGTRLQRRVRVPVSEHRFVIITYAAVRKVDAPPEAREKLKLAKVKP